MTNKSCAGTNPRHGRIARRGLVLLAAVLACCAWTHRASAYEPMGAPGPYSLRSPTWSLGSVTNITYSEDLTHSTNDVSGSGEWTAVQGVMQTTGALVYKVSVHARTYFPTDNLTMDATDVYTIPLFKFTQAPVGSASIQWAGWDDSALLTSAEVGITDPTRTIHLPDTKLHNSGLYWTTNVPEGQYSSNVDVGTVAMHEVGHALGLGHPNPAHPESVMYQGYDGIADRTWSSDDVNGLTYLYGPDPGVDYGAVVEGWHSIADGENWISNVLDPSGTYVTGYSKMWTGVKLPALRSGYFTIPTSGVQWSWDISWSLPSYDPQDTLSEDPSLSGADLLLAQDIWNGQNLFAPSINGVPEPTALSFLVLGGLALLRRRAR